MQKGQGQNGSMAKDCLALGHMCVYIHRESSMKFKVENTVKAAVFLNSKIMHRTFEMNCDLCKWNWKDMMGGYLSKYGEHHTRHIGGNMLHFTFTGHVFYISHFIFFFLNVWYDFCSNKHHPAFTLLWSPFEYYRLRSSSGTLYSILRCFIRNIHPVVTLYLLHYQTPSCELLLAERIPMTLPAAAVWLQGRFKAMLLMAYLPSTSVLHIP